MQTRNPIKKKAPSLRSFRCLLATLAISIGGGVFVSAAQAGYIVTLQQVGSNVVATGSGAIDLTGLSSFGPNAGVSEMQPVTASLFTGATGLLDTYGQATGPSNFGTGFGIFANSGSGDLVGIEGNIGFIFVPAGYISGTSLSDSAIYNSATLSSLGAKAGVYEWTWGTGVNQNFTINVIGAPDSGSTFGLLLVSLAGLFGASRLRFSRLA